MSGSAQEARLRDEICEVGASLHARGYTTGTAGNISARLEDGWLITPTDACLGQLDPARLAKVATSGEWLSGDKPSKTLALHRGIYARNAEAGGVLHTHSTHLVALTLAGVSSPDEVLPPDHALPGHENRACSADSLRFSGRDSGCRASCVAR